MSRKCIAIAIGCALAAVAAGAGGCQGFAWLVTQFQPPQKVKAKYTPPAGKRVLVFVDDVVAPVTYEPIKRELSERISSKLVEHRLVAETVPYDVLMKAISEDRGFNINDLGKAGVKQIGDKVGADLVLYVEIKSFRLKEDESSPLWGGRLETAVRWVDCHQDTNETARLWPTDGSSGFDLPAVGMPAKEDPSASYGTELAKILAERAADRIVKLFYDYEVAAQEGPEE
ncbi:MAG: hypothetical protein ACE15C_17035 [Phycisphaerae bacterium]